MTVGELADRMTAGEFALWMAFSRIEPFGSHVEDLRAGTIASATVLPWGGKTSPGEWFSWLAGERKPVGDWRMLKAAMGGYARQQRRAAGLDKEPGA